MYNTMATNGVFQDDGFNFMIVFRQLYKLIFVVVTFGLSNIAEASQARVAVLDFLGTGIEESFLHKLSDQARIAAANTLPVEEYQVMTKEGLLAILTDMGKDISCLSGSCEIEIARNIGADYIITGDILLIEETYLLTLKLHESQSGLIIAGKEMFRDSLLELITDSQQVNEELLVKGFDLEILSQPRMVNTALPTQSSQSDNCPWGQNVYSAAAKGHYVTVNNTIWEVRNDKQQAQFMDVLIQCDQALAALSFKQWRRRRTSSVVWAVSIVGTFYVAPWVAIAGQKSKQDMLRYLRSSS